MPILTKAQLALALNRDLSGYPGEYLDQVCADAEAAVATFLGYSPVLAVHTGEQGVARLVTNGPYAGRYFIELGHRPLVPGDAGTVFSDLRLTYALAAQILTQVNVTFVTVLSHTAQVFALAPGAVEALVGAMWGYAATPGLLAVGYGATYTAGYATGQGDPTPPGGGSYNAPPLPTDIRQAALLLARERLAMDDAGRANPSTAQAGYMVGQSIADEFKLQYDRLPPSMVRLGFGTRLAQQAERLLGRWARWATPTVIG